MAILKRLQLLKCLLLRLQCYVTKPKAVILRQKPLWLRQLKALKLAVYGLGGRLPDVLWDGYYNRDRAEGSQICLHDVSGVLDADGPNGNSKPRHREASEFACTLPSLPAVDLGRG